MQGARLTHRLANPPESQSAPHVEARKVDLRRWRASEEPGLV